MAEMPREWTRAGCAALRRARSCLETPKGGGTIPPGPPNLAGAGLPGHPGITPRPLGTHGGRGTDMSQDQSATDRGLQGREGQWAARGRRGIEWRDQGSAAGLVGPTFSAGGCGSGPGSLVWLELWGVSKGGLGPECCRLGPHRRPWRCSWSLSAWSRSWRCFENCPSQTTGVWGPPHLQPRLSLRRGP